MRSERLYLEDILESIRRIRTFTAGGHDEFLKSELIQMAVTRCFEIIGEAIKAISPARRESHPDILWSDIARFRDLLVHHYWRIQTKAIWNTIEKDLPQLEAAIRAELAVIMASEQS